MAEHDEGFHSDRLEEEIERYLSPFSAEDAQLMDDLREHYSLIRAQRSRTLARAWTRIRGEMRDTVTRQDQHEVEAYVFQEEYNDTWVSTSK